MNTTMTMRQKALEAALAELAEKISQRISRRPLLITCLEIRYKP